MAPPDDDLDKVTPPDAEPSVPPEVSRRDFLKTVGVAGAASGVAAQTVGLTAQTPQVQAQTQAPTSRGGGAVVDRPYMRIRQEVAENLVKRGIVGYASHLRVQPGETIRFMVNGCRNNRGVIRASLKHATTHPEQWLPHQKNGQALIERVVLLVVPRLPGPADAAELRVRFAMQVVFGTLVNAVLNKPGPLELDDERLPVELARMAAGYIGIDD